MIDLITKKPKRFFAIGCSFTNHTWPTYANLIAHELDIPSYNLGKGAAGNVYIANMVSQCDSVYDFNEDDLVIVQFSSLFREDKYLDNQWVTYKNYASQDYITRCMQDDHLLLRDTSSIYLVDALLKHKKCQYHLLSLDNIPKMNIMDTNILPSFLKTLWYDDYATKLHFNKSIHKSFDDMHPTVEEGLEFLHKTFEYNWSKDLSDRVNEAEHLLHYFVRMYYDKGVSFTEIDMQIHNAINPLIKFKTQNFDKRLRI